VFFCVGMGQRANIQFCFKLRKAATETHEVREAVYCNKALPRTHVLQFVKWWPETLKTPNINWEGIREVPHEDLGKRMIHAKFDSRDITKQRHGAESFLKS
jgi:hypothetical protein